MIYTHADTESHTMRPTQPTQPTQPTPQPRQRHKSIATLVAGLDLAAGRGRTALTVVELRHAIDRPCWQRATDSPALITDSDIVAALSARQPAVLAIDAPLSLPASVAAALGLPDASNMGPPHPDMSPYTRAAERDPIWRTLGVRPLPVSFLGGLTFRALTLLPLLHAALPNMSIIEVFPTGTFAALGIRSPRVEGIRTGKTTARTRAAVQDALRGHLCGLPDPATEPLDADTLDALACALAAAAYLRGSYHAAGDPREGQIILPA